MPVELGAHTLPYRTSSLQRALAGIAGAGYRFVGIWNDHEGGPVIPPDATEAQIAGVRRQIEAAGLTPRMAFRFPATPAEPAAAMRRSIQVCAALGIPCLLSSGPSPYAGRAFAERKRDMLFRREAEQYFAMLREVAPLAERAGVTIVMKPHMGVTGTGADLADIVEVVDHPAVRVCYDAGNIAFYEGLRPEDDVKDCARDVRAVCVKDHRGPRTNVDFPIPGEGDVDHASVFRTLLGAGFSGPALVERIDGQPDAAAMDAALAKARTYLERALVEAGA